MKRLVAIAGALLSVGLVATAAAAEGPVKIGVLNDRKLGLFGGWRHGNGRGRAHGDRRRGPRAWTCG